MKKHFIVFWDLWPNFFYPRKVEISCVQSFFFFNLFIYFLNLQAKLCHLAFKEPVDYCPPTSFGLALGSVGRGLLYEVHVVAILCIAKELFSAYWTAGRLYALLRNLFD
jgi:hypothetical protein